MYRTVSRKARNRDFSLNDQLPQFFMGRGDHSRVLVGNLNYNVNEDQLREELIKYGEIEHLEIPRGANDRSKGLGIVDYKSAEEADKVYEALNGTILFGRKCFIRFDDAPKEPSRRPRSPPRSYRRDRYEGYRERDDRYRSPPRRRSYGDYSDSDSPPRRARYDQGDRYHNDDYRRRELSPPSKGSSQDSRPRRD